MWLDRLYEWKLKDPIKHVDMGFTTWEYSNSVASYLQCRTSQTTGTILVFTKTLSVDYKQHVYM